MGEIEKIEFCILRSYAIEFLPDIDGDINKLQERGVDFPDFPCYWYGFRLVLTRKTI